MVVGLGECCWWSCRTSSSSVDSEPEFDDSDDSEVESLYIELSWATWPSSSPASVVRAPT